MVTDAAAEEPQLVDVVARSRLCNAFHCYLKGEIDNFQFDDILCETSSQDVLCKEIIHNAWYFYDDCTRQKCNPDKLPRRFNVDFLMRWFKVLQTEIDFDCPERKAVLCPPALHSGLLSVLTNFIFGKRPPFVSNFYWPFSSCAEWESIGVSFDNSNGPEAP